MQNQIIADIFSRFADVLEFKGELGFKINAYRKAARVLSELDEDIEKIWKEKRLEQVPGIGRGLAEKIDAYLSTGQIPQFEKAMLNVPGDLFKLLSIQNYGPKTAALAYKELAVGTLEDLKSALDSGELAKLPGMGEKKVENIRKGLDLLQTSESRISIGLALPLVDGIVEFLKKDKNVKKITAAGSVRRFRETVHDVDILAAAENGAELIQKFSRMPEVSQVLGAGETKGSVVLQDRYQVDLRVVKPDSFGAAQQYFTGSKAHNVRLREIAKKQGYKINEYGIFKGDQKLGGGREEDIYSLLDMQWIPPELREDRGEIEAALSNRIPRLVEREDIRADLHIHSNYSDGHLTLVDMARTVASMGYSYMCFCDHSKAARYANGLDEKRLLKQIEEIKKLNEQLERFTILAGCEVDILPDGSLDFDDSILAQLDFVVASIHLAFKTDPTQRTLAAIHNRYVDVIGHPTGRLLSRREGFEIQMDAVIKAAAQTGTALEVNSYWDRLDLSDLNVKNAVNKDVKICINTDAHAREHLPMMALGVGTARRGWAGKKDVINTMTVEELKQWQKRNRA
ncbi:DNA polymerase/3'-5' exonuclease PolX [candidate division KSB1 bacterium]|nr:DNA polymerase/3'-5' exonuclease PolX [candidate division KSB1 bacterium]